MIQYSQLFANIFLNRKKGLEYSMQYMPFLNFLLSFAGLILAFAGIVRLISIKKEFAMYFDMRDRIPEDTLTQKKRKTVISWILVAAGIICFVVSYITG